MKTIKYRLNGSEQALLLEALLVAGRHHDHLAAEADILGDPYIASSLRQKAREFRDLANEGQHAVRVTVRLDPSPLVHEDLGLPF